MNWLNESFLAVTAAALLAALLCWRIGAWRKRRALRSLLGDFAGDVRTVRVSYPRRFVRHVLLAVAIAALGVTAARPYWKRSALPVSATGRDVLVLFDVSKSMKSTDLAPSRLEHARYLLRELVAAFPGDRFGLIAFAGRAFLSCPLTDDGVAFEQYVDELSIGSVPVGGTDLEAGFAVALRALAAAGGEDKTLLVLTDGEELTGDSTHLIEKLKAIRVQIIIVGLGDAAGAPVLDDAGNFRRDVDGKIILSRLNETKLRQIAEACGGNYLHSTVTDNGFAAIRRLLMAQQRRMERETHRAVPVENFTVLLLVAIVALILYLLLSERKKRIVLLCVLGIGTLLGAETPASLYRDAVAFQQKGETRSAVEIYEKLLAEPKLPAPLAARIRQNLGVIPHEAAHQALADAEKAVTSQQLDAALKMLADGEKKCADAESYYAGAFALNAAGFDPAPLLDDLRLLDADRRKIEALKKKIEELQKQEQQARDKTKQAKQENQKAQKSPGRKDGKDQQKPENSALNEAAKETEKLSQSAAEMKQQKLQESAQKAKTAIEKARQAQEKNDRDAADRNLQEALAALGAEKQKEKSGASPEKQNQEQAQAADAGKEDKKQAQKSETDRLLRQMLDRENERRRKLAPASGSGRIPKVEKDW